MLKAIWPSLAHLPNHLPTNANITTSGRCYDVMVISDLPIHYIYRNDVLFSVLATAIPFRAYLASEDSMALPRQSNYCAYCVACYAHLGVRKSSLFQRLLWATRPIIWKWLQLGLVGCFKCGFGHLLNPCCQYSWLYCEYLSTSLYTSVNTMFDSVMLKTR